MRITYLQLENFRNHLQTKVQLHPGVNVFLGLNGQGKTNLVESLYFLSFGKSHRTSNMQAMINSPADSSAFIRTEIVQNTRVLTVESELKPRGANQFFLNKNSVTGKEIQRLLPLVMFSPEDLDIARDDPAERRRFLDELLTTRYPGSSSILREYERAVKQRNTLLKAAKERANNLDFRPELTAWNEAVADLGSQIIYHRRQTITDLEQPLNEQYKNLTSSKSRVSLAMKETLDIQNVSRETSADDLNNVSRETIRDSFIKALDHNLQNDIFRTQTSVGPHRDDLLLTLNDLPVKGFASHGETWSFVLSLRLASAALISEESYIGDPLLILDDVFAELDKTRQAKLYEQIKNFEQVIITSASEADVDVVTEMHVYAVEAAKVEPAVLKVRPRVA